MQDGLRGADIVFDGAAAVPLGPAETALATVESMTMEYPVGHYFRRTSVIARTIADADLLTEQVSADGGLY